MKLPQKVLIAILIILAVYTIYNFAYASSTRDLCVGGKWIKVIGHYYYCPTEDSYKYCSKLSSTNKSCYLMDESELPQVTLSDNLALKITKSDYISGLLDYEIIRLDKYRYEIKWKWKNNKFKDKIYKPELLNLTCIKTLQTIEKKINITIFNETTNKTYTKEITIQEPFIQGKPKTILKHLIYLRKNGIPVVYLRKGNFLNSSDFVKSDYYKIIKRIRQIWIENETINQTYYANSSHFFTNKLSGSFIVDLENAQEGDKIIIGFGTTEITVTSPDNCKYINDITPSFNVTPVGNYDYYNLTLYINGTERGNATNVPNNTPVIITSSELTSEGLYEWYVEAKVGDTSVANSTTMYFTLDTTPPEVTINYPKHKGRVRRNDFYLNFTYSEKHPDKIYYYIDDLPLNYTSPYNLADKHTVLWLKFDEGAGTIAHDSSQYSNDGTLYNGSVSCFGGDCPTWVDGKFGKALSFDGVNDYVEVPDMVMSGNKTLELWIKPNFDYDDGKQYGIMCWVYNDDNFFNLYKEPTKNSIYFAWKGQGNWNYISYVYNFTSGTWLHLAFTLDFSTGEAKQYINGELVKSKTGFTEIVSGSHNLRIGVHGAENYFNGLIDEVRIYNRALSEEEIKQLYKLTNKVHNLTAVVIDKAGNKGSATNKFSVRAVPTAIDYVFYSAIGSFAAVYIIYRLRRRRRGRRRR